MGHPAPLDLGHRTYLEAKAERENSMSAKRRDAANPSSGVPVEARMEW